MSQVRAYYDGTTFYSRNGIKYHAPSWFCELLPKKPLDGELWCGRGQFQKCVSIIKKQGNKVVAEDWKYVTYLIFDAPSHTGVYEERVEWLKKNIKANQYASPFSFFYLFSSNKSYAAIVGIQKCTGHAHLKIVMDEVLKHGGEGIMLRAPRSSVHFAISAPL